MSASSKLLRDVAACMAVGFLAVAILHPSVRASTGLVVVGAIALAYLVALAASRMKPSEFPPTPR